MYDVKKYLASLRLAFAFAAAVHPVACSVGLGVVAGAAVVDVVLLGWYTLLLQVEVNSN